MDTTPPRSPNRPILRRRNSISTVSARLAYIDCNFLSTTLTSSDDLELLPIKSTSHTYSSLRDLLPPPLVAVNSPKLKLAPLGSDICIRNRLVKQAARAYLTPMSDYHRSAGGGLFHRLLTGVAAMIDFFCRKVFGIYDGRRRLD